MTHNQSIMIPEIAAVKFAAVKGIATVTGLLCSAVAGGVMVADAITKDTNVSLESACIVGFCAVVLAGLYWNLKTDIKLISKGTSAELKVISSDIAKIKNHINRCKFAKHDDVDMEN